MIKRLWVFVGSVWLLFFLLLAQNPVQAQFMQDWEFDADAGGPISAETINEYWDISGISYIDNYNFSGYDPGDTFLFKEWGFFTSNSHDGGNLWDFIYSGYELTAIFYAEGSGVLGGGINLTTGWLEIYIDDSPDYENETSLSTPGIYYGANDGTMIARFQLTYGYGNIDTEGVPNGNITTHFQAEFIAPGYLFDSSGRDLSTYPVISWILGFSTTNASWVQNPNDEFVHEVQQWSGLTVGNTPPEDLVISGNGQWRLQVVPEPATIMLLGAGLLGVAVYARKKVR